MAATVIARLETAERVLATLQAILAEPYSVVIRDASIQRFEYTFEATWKATKAYLTEEAGIRCDAPKPCLREAARAGLLTTEETAAALRMTDDRNLTSHAYMEAVASRIYGVLPTYADVMSRLLAVIRARTEQQPA